MAKETYRATSRIDNINGKVIEPGALVSAEADDEAIEHLVHLGALHIATEEEKAAAKPGRKKPVDDGEKQDEA